MRYALISDIHSNIPALEAVLDDIKSQNVEKIYCLGDVIGYGPYPNECAEMVMNACEYVICGNHDEALRLGGIGFNRKARDAIEWTREQLEPGFFSGNKVRRRWEFLTKLPMSYKLERDYFVHGSPRDFTSEYVLPHDAQFGPTPKLQEIFAEVDNRLFLGHTHLPMILTDEYELLIPDDLGNEWESDPEQKVIINVGSVGQPRDKNPEACYVIVNGPKIQWRRVKYDLQNTVDRIKNIDRLDVSLAERLLVGV